jgi:TPR repeat protein
MAALTPRSTAAPAAAPPPAPVKQQETRSDPRPPMHHLDRDEVANLLERGQGFLQSGDIAAARLFLRRAADSGHAQAALALAATYDPLALKEFGVLGITPDVEMARFWYEKASQLGSAEAIRRLQRLAQQ